MKERKLAHSYRTRAQNYKRARLMRSSDTMKGGLVRSHHPTRPMYRTFAAGRRGALCERYTQNEIREREKQIPVPETDGKRERDEEKKKGAYEFFLSLLPFFFLLHSFSAFLFFFFFFFIKTYFLFHVEYRFGLSFLFFFFYLRLWSRQIALRLLTFLSSCFVRLPSFCFSQQVFTILPFSYPHLADRQTQSQTTKQKTRAKRKEAKGSHPKKELTIPR